MIIEREFWNKCWVCPRQHPCVIAFLFGQREDYFLPMCSEHSHGHTKRESLTRNCFSPLRAYGESKFHSKKYSLLKHRLFAGATQNYCSASLNPCASCMAEMGRNAKKSHFKPRFVAVTAPDVLGIDINTASCTLELADMGEASSLSVLLDQLHPSPLKNIWVLVSN